MRTKRRLSGLAVLSCVCVVAVACGARTIKTPTDLHPGTHISQLWQEPADLETRDLAVGPSAAAPKPDRTPFTFIRSDAAGFSPGYDVRDRSGLEWSV